MEFAAVIDLGSNSARLSIASVQENNFKNVFMKRNMVKLSQDMNDDMYLKKPAMRRTAETLAEFKEIIGEFGCSKTVIVATAAVRKAKNRQFFLDYIKETTDMEIRVIDGLVEAKLDFYGVLSSVNLDDFLIMDIGGGSTEIILVSERRLKNFESIPVGSRSITESFLTPETPEKILNTENIIKETFEKFDWLPQYREIPIVGLGGCLRACGKALSFEKNVEFKNGVSFSASEIIELYNKIKLLSVDERKEIEGIGQSRGDIILGGLMPFKAVSEKITATDLIVSDSGVRDGILYTLCNNIEIW